MAGKKKAAAAASTALVPITGTALAPILPSDQALAKIPGTEGTVAREKGVTLVADRPYATRDRTIPASEIYFVENARPREEGPWLHEADKVAWRDPSTGYECIMLRDGSDGFLSGHVGVPRDHPLWGWKHEAVSPELGIEVHGGLTRSCICEDGPSPRRSILTESRRICHVPLGHGSHDGVQHDHAWWFGFDCNHLYDHVPNAHPHDGRFLAAETATVYRDDAYVVREVTNLAAQLRAIADGDPVPPREGPPLPPLGLDPCKGG